MRAGQLPDRRVPRQHSPQPPLPFNCGKALVFIALTLVTIAPSGSESARLPLRAFAAVQRRIHVLLRREGWPINHKKIYRIYCEEGLNLRCKLPRRRVAAAHR